MRILTFLFLTLLVAALTLPAAAQQSEPLITSPVTGAALQGSVNMEGTTDVPGFVSMELSFAYADNPTDTWFVIATDDQPVSNTILGTWDTTNITDGTYSLRLRVQLSDGTYQDFLVTDLRVRNYTPVETPTATPAPIEATPFPTVTPTSPPFPTPTRLPSNPASVTSSDVNYGLLYGALTAIALFSIFGFLVRIRKR